MISSVLSPAVARLRIRSTNILPPFQGLESPPVFGLDALKLCGDDGIDLLDRLAPGLSEDAPPAKR